ncbi:MAG: putative acetyltransferase YhhY [Alphaproteobacteria bacterium ADurb.Bin438]|nr:MAG: putative acetyltransferase YhhY [Alphaproteobacteria bacterium ADurb.Bin438]
MIINENIKLKCGRQVLIRNLKAEDFDMVQEYLDKFSCENIFTNQYPGQPKRDRADMVKKYESEHSLFIGTFYQDKVVGSASIQILKPDHPWLCKTAEFGIGFLTEVQGLGLGSIIMKKLEDWARLKDMVRIEGSVRATNTKAISLYIKCGFVIEGLRKKRALINDKWYDDYIIAKLL